MLEIEQIFFFSLPSEKLRDLKRPSQFTGDQVAQVTKVTPHTKEVLCNLCSALKRETVKPGVLPALIPKEIKTDPMVLPAPHIISAK